MTIQELTNKYRGKIDYLDMEILIAHSLGKTREFVLMCPKHKITSHQSSIIKELLQRRRNKEPIAYIMGHKEFYGLDFIVNKHTLVPRPETEMLVEEVLALLRNMLRSKKTSIIDVGTGSGCIITSIAHSTQQDECHVFFGSDISTEALKMAKKNARIHNLDKKIKFIESDLLSAFMRNTRYKIQDTNLIITANLPYLSREIYASTPIDVKKFEPKSALYSPEHGLKHYRELLEQAKKLADTHSVTLFLEISPEQKQLLTKIIGNILPSAKVEFKKDLAGKWRLCKITC